MQESDGYRFSPSDDPLKVVFFFSGGASSMKAVLESPDTARYTKS